MDPLCDHQHTYPSICPSVRYPTIHNEPIHLYIHPLISYLSIYRIIHPVTSHPLWIHPVILWFGIHSFCPFIGSFIRPSINLRPSFHHIRGCFGQGLGKGEGQISHSLLHKHIVNPPWLSSETMCQPGIFPSSFPSTVCYGYNAFINSSISQSFVQNNNFAECELSRD